MMRSWLAALKEGSRAPFWMTHCHRGTNSKHSSNAQNIVPILCAFGKGKRCGGEKYVDGWLNDVLYCFAQRSVHYIVNSSMPSTPLLPFARQPLRMIAIKRSRRARRRLRSPRERRPSEKIKGDKNSAAGMQCVWFSCATLWARPAEYIQNSMHDLRANGITRKKRIRRIKW
jgi:hypothetical protein